MRPFDLHCDTLSKLILDKDDNLYDNKHMVSIKKMLESNYLAQCFACFVDMKKDDIIKDVLTMIDIFHIQLEKYKEYINLVLSYDDILKNQSDNKISAILAIEEGATLLGSINVLRMYHKLGVRMITLTWNYENEIGYPASPSCNASKFDGGLTTFGKDVVKSMNDLNMIIDVSHLSDKGFYDVLKTSKYPVVASHSNSRSICHHKRNLTDDMIVKLNENGGVMGINYYCDFVSDKGFTYVKDIVKHILHIKEIASIDVIALGSDFDGINENLEMKDASMMHLLIQELVNEGFTEEEIDKILYKNALRVFKKVLG